MAMMLLALLISAGCGSLLKNENQSLLRPAQMMPDSCVLDVFFVRVPFGDAYVNNDLWGKLDEQYFPPDLRQRLMHNGFRVGLVDGPIPVELTKLLEVTDKPPPDENQGANLPDLATKPVIVHRHMQVRHGHASEILASGTYEQWPVLFNESGQVCGETYNQAQGLFSVKTAPLPDGRVRIDLAPEVHHDHPRQQWVADQGMMRLETGRPKRVFDDMAVSATLAPGGIMVLSSLPSRPGSLGHYFFTENEEHLEQKVLVIRLTQTQHDGLFSPNAKELPLDK
jgi:hypothetical protein